MEGVRCPTTKKVAYIELKKETIAGHKAREDLVIIGLRNSSLIL